MLGNTIGLYRRKLGLTQEQLAKMLDVTNQAVSKWETDQCCPDVQLLPKLADCLQISLDTLFGRGSKLQDVKLPWQDDESVRIVLFRGHALIASMSKEYKDCSVSYDGPVRDVHCAMNLTCCDIAGNADAGGYIECENVGGNVKAGGYVECGDVAGSVNAGSYIECGDVEGDLSGNSYVECGDVGGSVDAMSYVECGDVSGNVKAGGYVECGDVSGSTNGEGKNDDSSGFRFHFNPFKK